jgi:hypothetical protein
MLIIYAYTVLWLLVQIPFKVLVLDTRMFLAMLITNSEQLSQAVTVRTCVQEVLTRMSAGTPTALPHFLEACAGIVR